MGTVDTFSFRLSVKSVNNYHSIVRTAYLNSTLTICASDLLYILCITYINNSFYKHLITQCCIFKQPIAALFNCFVSAAF